MKNITEEINKILGITESYQAPSRMMDILYNKDLRENTIKKFLELFDYNVSDDWFRDYFQDEHADRKNKKQDFTPSSVSDLVGRLIGDTSKTNGMFYEGCAGTGSMTIAKWNQDRMQHSPFDYKPSWYLYTLEELSDRAIPFLLFNLIGRGMNAIVIHCDVLSRKAKGVFFIQNDYDDHMKFSSLNVMPYTDEVSKYSSLFPIEWESEIPTYKPLVESPEWVLDRVLNESTPRGHVSDFTKLFYGLCGVDMINK